MNERLGDIVKKGGGKIHTGPFGNQLHASDYVCNGGIPCIMPADMKNNRVDLSRIAYISEQDAQRLSKYIVESGDIVFSRRGDVTQKALITDDEVGYFCGTGCLLLRPGTQLDSNYLTQYLSTSAIRKWLVNQSVGATMPNLNTGILADLPFKGPSLEAQTEIATVLTALEQKIRLNKKINAELEATVKLIYDYWFVQFDFPNEKGKPYKSSGGKMVWCDQLKRKVPEGWEIGMLGDWVDFQRGISYKKSDIGTSGLSFINLDSFKLSGEFKTTGTKYFSGKYKEASLLAKHSLIIAITDVTRNADIIGRAFHVPEIFEDDVLMSCDVARTIPDTEAFGYYLEMLFNSAHFHNYIKYFATGTLVLHLNLDGIRWFWDARPSDSLLEKFATIKKQIDKQKANNIKQNRELADLRDWLLSMLMSGQV